MTVLVLGTAAGVGVLIYLSLQSTLVSAELSNLQALARGMAASLEAYGRSARSDVQLIRELPAMNKFVSAHDVQRDAADTAADKAEAREWLTRAMLAVMEAHPEYLQFRLVGLEDEGRELIRIDRVAAGLEVRVVASDALQQKGTRDYFAGSVLLAPGEFYVSPVELNREHGEITVPHTPVLRVSTAVFGQEKRFGFVIANIDMTPILERVRQAAPAETVVRVVNEAGGFLVHPDPARAFGFDLGRPSQLADDYPDLHLPEGESSQIVKTADGRSDAIGIATIRMAGGPLAGVVAATPADQLGHIAGDVRPSSILVGCIAVLGGVLFGGLLARSVVGPLAQMSRAVQHPGAGRDAQLPVAAAGELGILARAFQRYMEDEAIFSAAFATTKDAMATTDLTGRISNWNLSAQSLFGVSRGDAIGSPIDLLFAETEHGAIGETMRKVASGEQVEDLEATGRAQDGRRLDISLGVSTVRMPDGEIVGLSLTFTDSTERKQEDERFRLAVEASPTGMVLVDDEGVIRLVNSEFEVLFGYSRHEVLGKRVEMLVPEGFRAPHREDRASYLRDPKKRSMGAGRNLFGLRKDGSRFPVEIGLNPITNPLGTFVLSAIVDISERQEADALIAARTAELERSNKELEQFAHIASHDLREPLRMVASYSELLAEKYHGRLDERADEYIHFAVDGARRMQQLIDDLLTFARVGTEGKPLVPVDPNEVVSGVLPMFEPEVEASGATIDCGELPVVEADEAQLRQVFQNLIGNALKFRSEDRAPEIKISAECDAGECVFSVSDNGIGMDMEHSKRIFQMFQRMHERGAYPGSGVGLAVAKKVIERHGGSLWVESKPGEGSIFHFTLRQSGRREKDEVA